MPGLTKIAVIPAIMFALFTGSLSAQTLDDVLAGLNLNSKADSKFTIYLDFSGHTTVNTPWNETYGTEIVTPAYSIDSNTNSFSGWELYGIRQIWQRVAEDFAPFDVNVTTTAPTAADLSVDLGNTATDKWGVRVVIGGSDAWFRAVGGNGASGVAYLSSFGAYDNPLLGEEDGTTIQKNWTGDIPAFVFTSGFGDNARGFASIADVISHEVGHTLGLEHDGLTTPQSGYSSATGEYYYGKDGWAPIMGAAHNNRNSTYPDNFVTQWSKGEYAGANNQQDDLAYITGSTNELNGTNYYGGENDLISYRDDDYGSTAASAYNVTLTAADLLSGSFSLTGIIERNTDLDYFAFTLTADALFQFDIISGIYGSVVGDTLATAGANLDILAKLFYGTDWDNPQYTWDPWGTLGITSGLLNLQAGTWYLSIEGTGKAGVYSDYGSIGTYQLIGTYELSDESSSTPEPATLLMFGAGLAGVCLAKARRANGKNSRRRGIDNEQRQRIMKEA